MGSGADDLGSLLIKGFINTLEKHGFKNLICGTCADNFNIKEKIAEGTVSNYDCHFEHTY